MATNMLSDNKVLRRLWDGPLKSLMLRLNGKRGLETEEMLNKLLRDELMVIPKPKPFPGVKIIKTVPVTIGEGRTTDSILNEAKDCIFINENINQINMPSGYGPKRTTLIEFGKFDYNPSNSEVLDWITEPGCGFTTYEDGFYYFVTLTSTSALVHDLAYVFTPENIWRDSSGKCWVLFFYNKSKLDLSEWNPISANQKNHQGCVFARRRYVTNCCGGGECKKQH